MVMAPHNSLSLYLIMVMLLFMTTPCLTKQKGEGATESEKRYLQMCPNQVMGIYLTSYSIFSCTFWYIFLKIGVNLMNLTTASIFYGI